MRPLSSTIERMRSEGAVEETLGFTVFGFELFDFAGGDVVTGVKLGSF